jgi:branched-subunit amino acid ABC-type transport system permease component
LISDSIEWKSVACFTEMEVGKSDPKAALGSILYAPLAQMAPFAIMLLILLIKPMGLYGSKLLKR